MYGEDGLEFWFIFAEDYFLIFNITHYSHQIFT